jgi:ABC-type amino acid transport substrate-binding protein
MKTTLFKILCITLLCSSVSMPILAGGDSVDLSSRTAIYFTGRKTSIDLKSDKYVATGGAIRVKKSDALSCQGDKCTFNLGIIAFRSTATATLKTYGQFTGKTLGIVGNTIIFNEGEKTKQQVLPVNLVVGNNIVTFTIDPNKQTAETDENNNSFDVRIVVE